jgi:hypothetical protein
VSEQSPEQIATEIVARWSDSLPLHESHSHSDGVRLRDMIRDALSAARSDLPGPLGEAGARQDDTKLEELMAMLEKGVRWPCQSHAHRTEKEAVACEKRAGEAGARLRALVAKWRELAEKDYHTATDDISDGVWTYQHEASGRSRAWKHAAAELETELDALLSAPVVLGDNIEHLKRTRHDLMESVRKEQEQLEAIAAELQLPPPIDRQGYEGRHNAFTVIAALRERLSAPVVSPPHGVTPQSEILAWLNIEQRKAERWAFSPHGVYRFAMTGPELMRIRHALGAVASEWQCRFVAEDARCCQLAKDHDGDSPRRHSGRRVRPCP